MLQDQSHRRYFQRESTVFQQHISGVRFRGFVLLSQSEVNQRIGHINVCFTFVLLFSVTLMCDKCANIEEIKQIAFNGTYVCVRVCMCVCFFVFISSPLLF